MVADESRPWYDVAFAAAYPILYAHRDDRSALREVDFVLATWRLAASDVVLDLCCGDGRHSRAFRSRGHRSIGLDRSPELLAIAKHRGGHDLVRGDMRTLPFPDQAFGAVASFFTSFGYFDTVDEDRRVLREIARVLARGGHWMLDFLDADHVRRTLVPESRKELDGREIVESRRILDGCVRKRIVVRHGDGSLATEYEERVRLYSQAELLSMAGDAGLRVDRVAGDFDGAETGSGTRVILLGRRTS